MNTPIDSITTTLSATASTRPSRRRRLVGALAGIALVASACGGSDDAEPAPVETDAPAEAPAEEPAAEPAAATVGVADNELGSIIVDEVGMTLYGFTPDDAGEPTCVDGCADAWPPYAVDGDSVPAGLDESIFSVVAHPSGVNQLKAGKWPLYYFAGDIAPGDTNGQGSGDVWFVAAADGSLIR
jgi:predicted lipoprotein with Yx(FWY)xxD motif